MSQSDDCIFCKILSGELEVSMVYQDDRCSAFMDIRPINPGHTLVIPNGHAGNLEELDEAEGSHMFLVAQRIAAALRNSGVRCEGVNLFLANGEAAGQEVFHVHLHVLPRYAGDGFGLRFGPHYANKPGRQELNEIADIIGKAMRSD